MNSERRQKMHILVTGGAGYIGSHTCKALAKAGYVPVVYDNLSSGHRELVRWGAFVHGDILDTNKLVQTISEYAIQGIIHFAALSQVGESVTHPAKYYQNNIGGTHSILEAMRLCSVKDIVFSSTCAVYGLPEQVPMDEECAKKPVNPYGMTKFFVESMLEDYSRAYGLCAIPLRYFNAAGCDPERETGEWHTPESHLVPRVLMAARGKIPALDIFGDDYPTKDGTCIRDYIHVSDLADAHVKALSLCRDNTGVTPVNLGTGQGFSVLEIIQTVEEILGLPVPRQWSGRRDGDPPILIANADKARRVLQWIPVFSDLKTIISTAAAWHDLIQGRACSLDKIV